MLIQYLKQKISWLRDTVPASGKVPKKENKDQYVNSGKQKCFPEHTWKKKEKKGNILTTE